MSDVSEVMARVYAFKHFRDLNPDKSHTSAEAQDCFTLADEIERLHAHVTNANGRASDYENRLLAALNDNERLRAALTDAAEQAK